MRELDVLRDDLKMIVGSLTDEKDWTSGVGSIHE